MKRMIFRWRNLLMGLIVIGAASMGVQAGPYYVIIGTFSQESSAAAFAASVRGVFADASFRYDGVLKVYHVYAGETSMHGEAAEFRDRVRHDNGFGNAWILTDLAALSKAGGEMRASEDVRLELYTGGTVLLASAENSPLTVRRSYAQKKDSAQALERTLKFIAENTAGGSMGARVTVLAESGAVIAAFKSGESVSFSTRSSRMLTLVCASDGYGTLTRKIDITDPGAAEDLHQNADGVWEVRFRLTKIKVDDIRLLYGAVFPKDAAVLHPEARKSVDALRKLLEDNEQWTIVINSHCNPGGKREILIPSEGAHFDETQVTTRSGSDRTLTAARAEVIRDYLVSQGIARERISVMGWGSLDRVVSPQDARGYLNERVEVVVGVKI